MSDQQTTATMEYRVMHVGDTQPAALEEEFARMSREFGWRFVAWHQEIRGVAIYERPVDDGSEAQT